MSVRLDKKRHDWVGIGLALAFVVVIVALTAWSVYKAKTDPNRILRDAIARQDLGDIEKAFQQGADMRGAQDDLADTIVTSTHNYNKNSKILDTLIQNGLDINHVTNKQTLLQHAITQQSPIMVRLLLKEGVQLDTAQTDDVPLLLEALQHDRSNTGEMAMALLDKGVDPNVRDKVGQIPMDVASAANNWALCKRLLQKGEKLDRASANRLLAHAVEGKSVDVVKLAFAQSADPNAVNGDGDPVLAAAVDRDDLAIARLLLTQGAEPNRINQRKPGAQPVIYTAVLKDNPKMIRLLLAHGADARSHPDLRSIAHGHQRSDIEDLLTAASAKNQHTPLPARLNH